MPAGMAEPGCCCTAGGIWTLAMMTAAMSSMPTGSQLDSATAMAGHIWWTAVAIEGLWNPVGMSDAGAPTNEGRNAGACRVRKQSRQLGDGSDANKGRCERDCGRRPGVGADGAVASAGRAQGGRGLGKVFSRAWDGDVLWGGMKIEEGGSAT